MQPILPIRTILIVMFLCVSCVWMWGQRHTPTPAAKAEYDKAEIARGNQDLPSALAGYRKAIELDPDYLEAHERYSMLPNQIAWRGAAGTNEEKDAVARQAAREVRAQYEKWAKERPQSAVLQFMLGELLYYESPDGAVRYYHQAVKLDPKFGAAYDRLAINAEEHGDLIVSRDFHRKAIEAEPTNVDFWGNYVEACNYRDFEEARQVVLQMAEKLPNDAPFMIKYLAGSSRVEQKSREMYELIVEKFPKQAPACAMPLFNMYLTHDRAKALALAKKMCQSAPRNKDWPLLAGYAQAVIDAEDLLATGKSAEALAALDKATVPRYGAEKPVLDVIRARAVVMSGKPEKAYFDLLSAFAKTPSDPVHATLLECGNRLGKNENQVEAEVMSNRRAAAKPGIPFSLVNYATQKEVSLDDYRGKVFLVSFWYPKCGPCRGEFRFLQQVLDKYISQGFSILAINGHPPEDEWVMPLINGWKLGFVPLQGREETQKAYDVRGFPSNFLYGADGRIYYQPPAVNNLSAKRELELQIEALLAEARSSARVR